MGARGTLRWAVNVTVWEPEGEEFDWLISTMPTEHTERIKKFVREEDRKRSLVSRLLQFAACREVFGLSNDEVLIKRTKGSKPFMANVPDDPEMPNWNFNVSHEGDFVVLAAEPLFVCGVDVAAPEQTRNTLRAESLEDFFHTMRNVLTPNEWRVVRSGKTEEEQEDLFRRHWSLKEAFVKGRGDGIAFELGKCEFSFHGTPWANTASVSVGNHTRRKWRFYMEELGNRHWVSVARGPPSDIVDAHGEFKGQFRRPEIPVREHEEELRLPSPPFEMRTVADLVETGRKDDYASAGGDVI